MDTPENQDWEKTTNRYVAFLDIMGFKDLVQRQSHEDILEKLEGVKRFLKKLETADPEEISILNNLNIEKNQVRSITFSDSIILFSKSDTLKDLQKIMMDSGSILRYCIKKRIGIKGTLSYGKVTVDYDNHLFFGQPIIDAYLLHDELSLYSIVLDNNIEEKANTFNGDGFLKNIITTYKTPLKSGKITHKLIRFPKETVQEIITGLEKMYESVSGRPRLYIDNSLDFFNLLKKETI